MAVDAKQAARIAAQYIREMYEDEHISDVRLEEIEYKSLSATWQVTISFALPSPELPASGSGALAKMLGMMKGPTLYKVVSVESNRGTVVAMKIRESKTDA